MISYTIYYSICTCQLEDAGLWARGLSLGPWSSGRAPGFWRQLAHHNKTYVQTSLSLYIYIYTYIYINKSTNHRYVWIYTRHISCIYCMIHEYLSRCTCVRYRCTSGVVSLVFVRRGRLNPKDPDRPHIPTAQHCSSGT